MNHVVLMGRLTRDPEVRYSQGADSTAVARYSLAVDRGYKKDGQASADFISCIAFGKTAEFVEKYLYKGRKVAVQGKIQTGSYQNKDGKTVYTTDVLVNNHYFCESRSNNEKGMAESDIGDGFMSIPDNADCNGFPFF